jgi:hypothetical protein
MTRERWLKRVTLLFCAGRVSLGAMAYTFSTALRSDKKGKFGIWVEGLGGAWVGDVPKKHAERVVNCGLDFEAARALIIELGGDAPAPTPPKKGSPDGAL